MADEKDIIVEFLKGKSASKSKFYFKDFTELFPDKGPREVKKILTRLVNEEAVSYTHLDVYKRQVRHRRQVLRRLPALDHS